MRVRLNKRGSWKTRRKEEIAETRVEIKGSEKKKTRRKEEIEETRVEIKKQDSRGKFRRCPGDAKMKSRRCQEEIK